eukprot:2095537-Prymnesium_polylepis.1
MLTPTRRPSWRLFAIDARHGTADGRHSTAMLLVSFHASLHKSNAELSEMGTESTTKVGDVTVR